MNNIKLIIKDICLWVFVMSLVTLAWIGIEKMVIEVLLS
ncbi:hypothetical protein IC3_05663 [Bacillus cereus VD142]|nr:hypothetical protein IC3_05663 [Bacillus cereus VD142]